MLTPRPPVGAAEVETVALTEEASGDSSAEELSEQYSEEMQAKMGTSQTYVHEDGMNYNRITDDLVVGSCPQTAADVDRCAAQRCLR